MILGIVIIIGILFSLLLKSSGILTIDNNTFSFIIVTINSIALLFYLLLKYSKPKKYFPCVLIYLAYLIRMGIAFFDVYIKDLNLSDADTFRTLAEQFSYTNLPIFNDQFSLTASILGSFYKIFGVQRFLLQHANVLLMVSAGIIVYSILTKLEVDDKAKNIALLWVLFSPWNVMLTSGTTREAEIIFLLTVSLYFFAKWFNENKTYWFVLSLLFVVAASLFHGGVIAVAIGYAIIFIFYDHKELKYKFSFYTVFSATVLISLFSYVYIKWGDTLFVKLNGIEDIESISRYAGRSTGKAGYSAGGESVDSIIGLILYAPKRMFYFLFSPIPWEWRGIIDFMAFIGSSLIYLIAIISAIRVILKKFDRSKQRKFVIAIFICCIIGVFVFSWGTRNAGTAIRHRDKFLSLFAVMFAASIDKRNLNKNFKKGERL